MGTYMNLLQQAVAEFGEEYNFGTQIKSTVLSDTIELSVELGGNIITQTWERDSLDEGSATIIEILAKDMIHIFIRQGLKNYVAVTKN